MKQCRAAIAGPECPVCLEELKPPLKVVQCEAGHKVGQQFFPPNTDCSIRILIRIVQFEFSIVRSVSRAAKAFGARVKQSQCALAAVEPS